MFAKVYGAALQGIDGYLVEVEVNIGVGLPVFEIVGLPNASVREAKERVRAAIENSGFKFPLKRIVINLAPAHMKKHGSGLDLPIAIGILVASEQLNEAYISNVAYAGELSLEGKIRTIEGILPMALSAKASGLNGIYTAIEHIKEAEVRGYKTLKELINSLQSKKYILPKLEEIEAVEYIKYQQDLQDVQGQMRAKRALEIAAAGGHNLLMVGPPGSGKTMLAERIVTILPELTPEEALDVTKIYSVTGDLGATSIISTRPFRSPHHTITASGMVGGGHAPKPGEVTLSHHGILFLDELPEFSRNVLEVLRQPLEDGVVQISRVHGAYKFPAKFSLIVAMNPCPCGYYGDVEHQCVCSAGEIQRYRRKISGPLLDRIDLFVEVKKPTYEEISAFKSGEKSELVRNRVVQARSLQENRFTGIEKKLNAYMTHRMLEIYATMSGDAKMMMKIAFEKMKLSGRSYDRIIKVARTIADLRQGKIIEKEDIAEAISYRDKMMLE